MTDLTREFVLYASESGPLLYALWLIMTTKQEWSVVSFAFFATIVLSAGIVMGLLCGGLAIILMDHIQAI